MDEAWEFCIHDGGMQLYTVPIMLSLHEVWSTLEELGVKTVDKPLQSVGRVQGRREVAPICY